MEKHTTAYGSKYDQKHRKQFLITYFDVGDKEVVDFITGNGGIPFVKDFLRLVAADQEPFQEFIDKARKAQKAASGQNKAIPGGAPSGIFLYCSGAPQLCRVSKRKHSGNQQLAVSV